uniref:Putative secreted protein n=1 Tax=Panstrongylus lignarius TaxID=156445 RepID=A0A224Y6J6_9HEMI
MLLLTTTISVTTQFWVLAAIFVRSCAASIQFRTPIVQPDWFHISCFSLLTINCCLYSHPRLMHASELLWL